MSTHPSPSSTWARESLRRAIAFQKMAATFDDWWSRRIAIIDTSDWVLLPLCELHRNDDRTADLLGEWRAGAQYAYPTRFPVTREGTSRWIGAAVLDNPDRMLFLISDALARPIGHVGVVVTASTVEVDNLLRGESTPQAPALMRAATRTLMRWASRESACTEIEARVLASNHRSRAHFGALGFAEVDVQPLVTVVDGESTTLVPAKPGEVGDESFVVMRAQLDNIEDIPEWIPTAGPSIGADELAAVTAATTTGWQSHHSDALNEFHQRFGDYVGSTHAIATTSCTAALHLALLAVGIGAGDEVIVPDITWVASAAAVAYTGATPVFADVDDNSWVMNVDTVRPLITERTRAIMPVHLYGFAAPVIELRALADHHGLWLIEDAAPAIGTRLNDRHVGTIGHVGCFSFQGAKMLVTGEGGMLITDNDEIASTVRHLNDHGRVPGTFQIARVGRKYKMNNISAALGVGQLARIEPQIALKRRINEWYAHEFANVSALRMQESLADSEPNCWMSSVRIDPSSGVTPADVAAALANDGIDSRPVFTSLRAMPVWDEEGDARPSAHRIGSESLNLPSGVHLPRAAVQRVATSVKRALGE